MANAAAGLDQLESLRSTKRTGSLGAIGGTAFTPIINAPEVAAYVRHENPMNNRQVILTSRPVGVPRPSHFDLRVTQVAALEAGEFLVENLYLSVDPAQRGYVNDENNYSPPVPPRRRHTSDGYRPRD